MFFQVIEFRVEQDVEGVPDQKHRTDNGHCLDRAVDDQAQEEPAPGGGNPSEICSSSFFIRNSPAVLAPELEAVVDITGNARAGQGLRMVDRKPADVLSLALRQR